MARKKKKMSKPVGSRSKRSLKAIQPNAAGIDLGCQRALGCGAARR